MMGRLGSGGALAAFGIEPDDLLWMTETKDFLFASGSDIDLPGFTWSFHAAKGVDALRRRIEDGATKLFGPGRRFTSTFDGKLEPSPHCHLAIVQSGSRFHQAIGLVGGQIGALREGRVLNCQPTLGNDFPLVATTVFYTPDAKLSIAMLERCGFIDGDTRVSVCDESRAAAPSRN